MSCPHIETKDFDKVEVQGHLITLVQCVDCKQIGTRRKNGIDWSGEVPRCRHCGQPPLRCSGLHDYEPDLRNPIPGALRQRDFELAMQRLRDTEFFFGLIAERWDIQTATLVESILKSIRELAESNFEDLITVAGLSIQLAQQAKRDHSREIINHLVERLGGEVVIPNTALEPAITTTMLHLDHHDGFSLKVVKRPSAIR